MSRYIDAEKIDWRLIELTNMIPAEEHMIHNAKKLVERQPTADDVVEVVRCDNCKWNYIHVTPKGKDYHICKLLNLAFDNDDNFFCAYGEKEKRDGEPIQHWRGQTDGCLPFQLEVEDEQIH